MTNCTEDRIEFPSLKRRKIEAEFSGGDVSSDGDVLLLRLVRISNYPHPNMKTRMRSSEV